MVASIVLYTTDTFWSYVDYLFLSEYKIHYKARSECINYVLAVYFK
jgi:hypothetical protein